MSLCYTPNMELLLIVFWSLGLMTPSDVTVLFYFGDRACWGSSMIHGVSTSVHHLWILKLTGPHHPADAVTCVRNWTRFVLSPENFSHTFSFCYFGLSQLYSHDSELEPVVLNQNSNYPVWSICSTGKMGHYINLWMCMFFFLLFSKALLDC